MTTLRNLLHLTHSYHNPAKICYEFYQNQTQIRPYVRSYATDKNIY